jgi:signal transduction histidine kinase
VIEAGRLGVDLTTLSPLQLVNEAVETQRPLAAASSLELTLALPHELPQVWADHDRLLQVFENLIGNALKFTAPGGRITVGAMPAEQHVVFWVADSGKGIAPENLPHVFDPFWQASARERRLGAGLGLPITKGIVEAHGGSIWVESVLGQGTTLYFTVPVTAGAERAVGTVH